MPLADEKQPDPALIKKVTDWIDAELAKAGKNGVVLPGSLKAGNYVPHDLLFGPKAAAPLDAPPRLWRVSPEIYAETIKEINKNLKLPQPFNIPGGDGFKDRAAGGTIDEATAAQLIRNAEVIVAEQLGQSLAKLGNKKPLAEFAPLLSETAASTAAQVDAAVRKQFEIVLRRKPTDQGRGHRQARHRGRRGARSEPHPEQHHDRQAAADAVLPRVLRVRRGGERVQGHEGLPRTLPALRRGRHHSRC